MDNIRPLRSIEDYDWAVKEIEAYFDVLPAPNTPEAERFDVLCDLVDAYDAKHFQMPAADPVEVIVAYMDENGWNLKDLAALLGQKSKASEVLNRRRPLSLAMIQKITGAWDISADLLIKPYHLDDSRLRRAG